MKEKKEEPDIAALDDMLGPDQVDEVVLVQLMEENFPQFDAKDQEMFQIVASMEKFGIITPLDSAEWASPLFLVPKTNSSYRVVADFRHLNFALKEVYAKSRYMLPLIDELMQNLA